MTDPSAATASESAPRYIDSHAHLYFDRFDDDRSAVIDRARERGFEAIINIGTDLESSGQCVQLATDYPGYCFAAVGLHPTSATYAADELQPLLAEFERMIVEHPEKVVAVGETGIDYYWDAAPAETQKEAFARQLELAMAHDLPVVIHCRNSKDDATAMTDSLDMVARYPEARGVFHCFGGDASSAERALELGWHVSFAGNVTFPKAYELRDAARVVPLDRLLLETDAPFLAPQAVRGQRNEPAFAAHTLAFLAQFYEQSEVDLARMTTANARRLFRL